jgi:hypothetical protein
MAVAGRSLGRRDVRLDRVGRLGDRRAVEHPASEAGGEKRSDHMHFHCVVLPWRSQGREGPEPWTLTLVLGLKPSPNRLHTKSPE